MKLTFSDVITHLHIFYLKLTIFDDGAAQYTSGETFKQNTWSWHCATRLGILLKNDM